MLPLFALSALSPAWSTGHTSINKAVLRHVNSTLGAQLNATNATWPPGTATRASVASLVEGAWAHSGDTVAGPCAPNKTTPCAKEAVLEKMALRKYCYAEDSAGKPTLPWPYAIPACNPGGLPPGGWAACLPGPVTSPWLYHYFTKTPPQNLGFEGRGAAWFFARAAAALLAGNVKDAALFLSCFAHGLEDRSSPYHNFGGFEKQRDAIDQRYNLTSTCKDNIKGSSARCFVLFWAANDDAMTISVDGYEPLVLGADAATAGAAVGARMEEISAASRELTVRVPGGYVDSHLKDAQWWTGNASAATKGVMGQMAQLSTRLVADAWHTAWALAASNSTASDSSKPDENPIKAGADADAEAQWQLAVDRAAAFDRQEPVWPHLLKSDDEAPRLWGHLPRAYLPEPHGGLRTAHRGNAYSPQPRRSSQRWRTGC